MPLSPRIVAARLYAAGAALAFGLSLATGVLLDRARQAANVEGEFSSDDVRGLLINLTLFTVFAVHHSVLARPGVKARLTRHLAPALERSTYVWTASALFAAVCLLWRPLPHLVYELDPPWAWACTAIRAAGFVLTLDAAARIDLRELSGLRQAWRYGADAPQEESPPAPLVARGGYRLVRHPIYLGWILIVWGVPRATAGWMAFAAISTAYLLVAIPFEERALRARFGRGYARYLETVPWRVLPGVY